MALAASANLMRSVSWACSSASLACSASQRDAIWLYALMYLSKVCGQVARGVSEQTT